MHLVYSIFPANWAILGTCWRSLTLLQRYSWCILQSQSTGPSQALVDGVLPLWRDAVGVFYSPSQLRHFGHLSRVFYPSAEMQSVYSIVPIHWAVCITVSIKSLSFLKVLFDTFHMFDSFHIIWWRCPWCNGYGCRKWTWVQILDMAFIAFHIGLIPLGKVWIQLFSL